MAWKDGAWSGASSLFSILPSNTVTCSNTEPTWNSLVLQFYIDQQLFAWCFMIIVICQPGIREKFSIIIKHPWWLVHTFCSCALVAGSGCVRACGGETRYLAMVSFNFYTHQQWVRNVFSTILMIYGTLRLDLMQFSDMLHFRWLFIQMVWHSMTRWLLPLFKYYFFWMKMLTVFFLCALVCGYNVRVTEGLSVHLNPSGCTVHVGVYASMCLLSAETAGQSSIARPL